MVQMVHRYRASLQFEVNSNGVAIPSLFLKQLLQTFPTGSLQMFSHSILPRLNFSSLVFRSNSLSSTFECVVWVLLQCVNCSACILCEQEISWLDMSINSKKSCCMRIGPRCNFKCSHLTTSCGSDSELPWVTDLRYLGIYITQSRFFECESCETSIPHITHCRLRSCWAVCLRGSNHKIIHKQMSSNSIIWHWSMPYTQIRSALVRFRY